jgi:Tfp pilus assembly protein PilN
MVDELIPDEAELDEEAESEQPQGSSRLIQWLILIGLAVLFVPLYLASMTIKQDTASLQLQATDLAATLAGKPRPNPTESALNGTLVQLRAQFNALSVAQPTVAANRLDWPSVMAVIGSYDQTQLVLTNITQNGKTITLNGQSVDENAVMAYAQQLKDSKQFTRVTVQGIVIKPSPTVTPSATPTSTPSPTPSPLPSAVANATLPPINVPTPIRTTPVAADELWNKFAGFTILLEAKAPVDATPSQS